MVKLTKINGTQFFVNADLIEFIESTPDTIITLTTGKKLIVKEEPDQIVDLVIQFKSRALRNWNLQQTDNDK